MEKRFIISLGREFGSGGHEIAEKLAEHYGIHMYDRKMLDEIAKEKNLDIAHLEKLDEKPRNPIFSRRVNGYSNSPEEILAEMQFEYIKKKANSDESFVIVGRCSEAVLHDRDDVISIFVLGNREEKLKRVMAKYDLGEAEALSKMNRHDKTRKKYHNHHAVYKWGDSRGYDICINSSVMGVDKTVEVLIDYINRRIK